ncbi:MAG TPA: hypothetical protein PLQ57_08325 [Saprospiraceae bacterium]|nr:hypothetical protein [Saprospiraceae bacterium]
MKEAGKILIFSFCLALPLLTWAQSKDLQHYFKPSLLSIDTLSTRVMRSQQKPISLPFFCAMEEKIYQKSGINMRLRLGSVQYTDYLEKKNTLYPTGH